MHTCVCLWQGGHFQKGSQEKSYNFLVKCEDIREPGLVGGNSRRRKPQMQILVGSEPATFKDQQEGHGARAECPMGRQLGDETERLAT